MPARLVTIAVPKGRVLKAIVPLLRRRAAFDPALLAEGDDRRLIREVPHLSWRFLLLKPDDVPTYVEYGAADLGIVLGGSGNGEQLVANKVHGVRAALCNDLFTARFARAHNDANVLSMGARVVGVGLAEEILAVFLATPFEGGRHARRVEQVMQIEAEESRMEQ